VKALLLVAGAFFASVAFAAKVAAPLPPPSQSLLAVSDPFTSVMAFNLADDRSGAAILRLVEMEGIDKTVTVKLPFKVSRAVRCNIIEEEQGGPEEAHDDMIALRLGHHAIETVKVYP